MSDREITLGSQFQPRRNHNFGSYPRYGRRSPRDQPDRKSKGKSFTQDRDADPSLESRGETLYFKGRGRGRERGGSEANNEKLKEYGNSQDRMNLGETDSEPEDDEAMQANPRLRQRYSNTDDRPLLEDDSDFRENSSKKYPARERAFRRNSSAFQSLISPSRYQDPDASISEMPNARGNRLSDLDRYSRPVVSTSHEEARIRPNSAALRNSNPGNEQGLVRPDLQKHETQEAPARVIARLPRHRYHGQENSNARPISDLDEQRLVTGPLYDFRSPLIPEVPSSPILMPNLTLNNLLSQWTTIKINDSLTKLVQGEEPTPEDE